MHSIQQKLIALSLLDGEVEREPTMERSGSNVPNIGHINRTSRTVNINSPSLNGEDILDRKSLDDIVIVGRGSGWKKERSADDAESRDGSKMRETHDVDGCMPARL